MRQGIIGCTVVAFLFAVAGAEAQQGRAELRGSVTDQQGAALPGVTILITNQDTGTFREVISTGDGGYFAGQMLPGVFTITAQLPGFSTFERTDFAIGVGRTLDLDIVMRIGALEETVTVTGEAPLVDLSSAEVGGTINTSDLTDLPTGNRSYFAAIALLPGVQFRPSTSLGNDTIIVNGQHPNTNNVAVDGAANNDDNSGTWAGGQTRVPLESVQEFQVITNQFDAEFGRAAGAVINSITKQGTNEFTGSLFNYFTSNNLTAYDYFVAQDPDLQRVKDEEGSSKQEFGGVIGGPILRDRAHFFFSLERQLVAPGRTKVFATRPELNFTHTENWTAWNTLIRFDQQVNANNTWAFRWLRELAPQFELLGGRQATLNALEDETDNDQTYVGSWTSVIGSDKVNTVRVSATREQYWARQSLLARSRRFQRSCGPVRNAADRMPRAVQLRHLHGQPTEQCAWEHRQPLELLQHLLLVRARHDGGPRPQVRRDPPQHVDELAEPEHPERPVQLQYRPGIRPGRLRHLAGAALHSSRRPTRGAAPVLHPRGVRAGQVVGEPAADPQPRRAVRPGGVPARESEQPVLRRHGSRLPHRREQLRATDVVRITTWPATAARCCGAATASSTTRPSVTR